MIVKSGYELPVFGAYPIMAFDERVLMPAMGYLFQPAWLDPQESIVSILWKFARMNLIAGHIMAGQLPVNPVDPYEGISACRRHVNIRHLHHMLGLQMKLLRCSLLPETLHAISSPYFRYCTCCMRRGYHSVLYQIENVIHCPIHDTILSTACRICGQKARYQLDAQLLDTPFRCSHCRHYYATCAPRFLDKKPLKLKWRVAVTRLRLHYFTN